VVGESFKGGAAVGSRIVVRTGRGGGDCGYPFKADIDYLVFATRGEDGTLTTNICSRTAAVQSASADLEYARTAAAGTAPTSRVVGVIGRYNRAAAGRQLERMVRVPGVTVRVEGVQWRGSAISDSAGLFTVDNIPAGVYRVTPELPDHLATQNLELPEIEIASARHCAETLIFVVDNGRVSGQVVDAAGKPVAGLRVALGANKPAFVPTDPRISARTNHEGKFELSRIPAGTFAVVPGAVDPSQGRTVTIAAGKLVEAGVLRLPADTPYAPIVGVVVDTDGFAVQGAKVYLRDAGLDTFVHDDPVVTNASGQFVFAVREGYDYQVFAERVLHDSAARTLETSDPAAARGGGASVRLTLRRR
jgi:hypothetical protein